LIPTARAAAPHPHFFPLLLAEPRFANEIKRLSEVGQLFLLHLRGKIAENP
jgi:hypothetical protein